MSSGARSHTAPQTAGAEREPALETVPPAAPADWGSSLGNDETPF